MIGDSLTTDNLLDILKAMQKIKPIDQSQYFENYMGEIMQRLKENEKSKTWIESQLSKAMAK
jgi:preprotein translocase subunit Sec63